MKQYQIKITDNAASDMESIYQYIADDLQSPQTAINQYNRIAEAIMKLESLPERFPIFDCEPEKSRKIYKMVIDNYLVCYVIEKDSVVVIKVLYGASDIHRKLQSKL